MFVHLLLKIKMQVTRSLYQNVFNQCFKGKIIILIGPRQVGKTTLLKKLQENIGKKTKWLNADEADILQALTNANTSTQLQQLFGADKELVIIDEAQQIPNIGKKLKLIYDNFPTIQVIATGSYAFELQNETNEPLTGRKKEFYMFPMSFSELVKETDLITEKRMLNTRLVFGSYPEVINNPGNEKEVLRELVTSYLYKDLLKLDGIRKSTVIEKILQTLAFQVGSEVNFHELAQIVGNIDTATVEKYIGLLEKAYIIFKLPALSRNLRNELKKGKKYYFYDNGIRNVIISNYQTIDLRQDVGALWENYLLAERLKKNNYTNFYSNNYFWRTHDQAEIDYIEENDGVLNAYEFKWKNKKIKFPNSFLNAYPNHQTQIISTDNYTEFIEY
jgi:predicted AAA+ superfamily ATPase